MDRTSLFSLGYQGHSLASFREAMLRREPNLHIVHI